MDLATGTGSVAGVAALADALVVGVDISPGILVTAWRLWGDHVAFFVADAATLPFASQSFDVVTSGLGLSHLSRFQPAFTDFSLGFESQATPG